MTTTLRTPVAIVGAGPAGLLLAHLLDEHGIDSIVVDLRTRGEIESTIRAGILEQGTVELLDRLGEHSRARTVGNRHDGIELHFEGAGHRIDFPSVTGRSAWLYPQHEVLKDLIAARVAAERGHKVTVLEASGKAGGQIGLAVQNPRRRELVGIVDWRLAELDHLGVTVRYDCWAEAGDVLELAPDVVVIATGGLPQNPPLEAGDDLVLSSWDILSGAVKPAENVLLYDDNGGHQGMSAAEMIGNAGAKLELVSPERLFAPEMGGMNHVPYMRAFHERHVRVTINTRLVAVRREGNGLVATLGSDYAKGWSEERHVDQVVVEHGTMANDELYHALKSHSRNGGAVDYESLVGGQGPLFPKVNAEGAFELFRIGDAVAARNIHAAIYDGIRYAIRL